jgi:C-terminal processing protease CtpA/Prc
MIQRAVDDGIPGIIIDMRNNGGGSGFLADQMAAYFFQEELPLGNRGRYDEDTNDFYFAPHEARTFILPPEELRYDGDVVVLVGPSCASACEFFSYDMTINDRATIIGQYPTAGLGGGVEDFFMPEGLRIRMTVARSVDPQGSIHIEGRGVVPDVRVPVTEETLFAEGDPVLDAAINYLNSTLGN